MIPSDEARDKIVQILTKVQSQLCPGDPPKAPLTGTTIPAKEIGKFDSKVWPLAKARIARELKIDIPPKERLFVRDKGIPVSIDELVNRVCALSKIQDAKQEKSEVA